MKLSFSTRGWSDFAWDTLCASARAAGLTGIEVYNADGAFVSSRTGMFHPSRASATFRELRDDGLVITCVDSVWNAGEKNADTAEIENCISVCYDLRIPFVRVRTDDGADITTVEENLKRILPLAEKKDVVLLIETVGTFANTEKLRDMLERFACDNVAALWDMNATYRDGGESADATIKNLGAFVRHVHLKDSEQTANGTRYCLIGEGSLPVDDMMRALRSVNYEGFVSLEWDPSWLPELADPELVFSHFASFMKGFSDTARAERHFYYNKTHTGRFIWKKEELIDCTFPKLLDTMVDAFPDQCAFKYTTLDYTRTYKEFRDDVDTFARALIALGIKKGSKVSVWATNLPEWYIAFWATTKIGAVLVTVNTAYKIHEVEYLLKQSDTHTLILEKGWRDSDYAGIIDELCPELKTREEGKPLHSKRLPFLRNVISVGFRKEGFIAWEDAVARASEVPVEEVWRRAANVVSGDVANMQYTSGTTGFPKGVMLTHHNIVNNGKCIGDRMDLSTADRMMIQVPMFHCFGMVLAMTASMTHGSTVLPLPYFSPKPALACINEEKITAFHGVPTMFIALLEHPDFPKTDFSCMRTGIMAGSPCPVSVMKDVTEKMNMKEITIVYGQTEASPGCTMSSTDDPIDVRVSTVGRPLPEIECKIVDPETGEECPDGVTGEFVARGYNVMKGYYKMPVATAAAIDKDGWLHTGDLACRNPDGNFRITGRLKDMIIRGGENIYPKEIEEFIYTHPKVRDVQVIGVPDRQYGEEVMACVILKEGETMTEQEMKDYVNSHMARHKVPRYIEFVDSFPMNAAGKILKYKMREDAVEKIKARAEKK